MVRGGVTHAIRSHARVAVAGTGVIFVAGFNSDKSSTGAQHSSR